MNDSKTENEGRRAGTGDPAQFLGEPEESDLGAERGPQPHRPTTGTVGGGTESDRAGGGTSATPGLSGGADTERLTEEDS